MERWYGGKPIMGGGSLGAERWRGGSPVAGSVRTAPSLLVTGTGVVQDDGACALMADALVTDGVRDVSGDAVVRDLPSVTADGFIGGQRVFPLPSRRFPRERRDVPRTP